MQGVYDQIENRVNEMMSSGTLDEKRSIAYKSFLFIIMSVSTCEMYSSSTNKFQSPGKQRRVTGQNPETT